MDFQIDMRVTELLVSRLCHDLVGPIGAVNNGIELMTDVEFGPSDDALLLAGNSARQAASILQFYRLAYGMAGGRITGDFSELRELTAGFLASSKITLDWTVRAQPEGAPADLGKLLLNLVALAMEMLPRGGKLTVAALNGPAGLDASVTATGQGAKVREEIQPALADDAAIEDLTPRNVHGYFTRQIAQHMGSDLIVDTPAEDSVRISVTLRV